MTARRLAVAIGALALGVGAAVVPAAAGAGKRSSKVKTITVADDYYSTSRLTIKKGHEIKWVWSRQNFDSHNVTLISGPKGVNEQKLSSPTGVAGIRFERAFLKPGRYHFQCTIHPATMNMILTVRK